MYKKNGDIVTFEVPKNIKTKLTYGKYQTLSAHARQHKALGAVGGTVLFEMSTGRVLQALKTPEDKPCDTKGGIIFYLAKNGTYKVRVLDSNRWIGSIEYDMVWGFECVCRLVAKGKPAISYKPAWSSLINIRAPRTAYGVRHGQLVVVTVDGYNQGRGMTANELANHMVSLGCSDAVMPDGGGSTELYLNGRILNKLSGGAERRQPVALLFFDGEPQEVAPAEGITLTRLVRYGSIGTDVKSIQEALNNIGSNCGAADGIFGPLTDAGVRAYQQARELAVDGIVGPLTIGKINGEIK